MSRKLDPEWEDTLKGMPPALRDFAEHCPLAPSSYHYHWGVFGSKVWEFHDRQAGLWLQIVFDGREDCWSIDLQHPPAVPWMDAWRWLQWHDPTRAWWKLPQPELLARLQEEFASLRRGFVTRRVDPSEVAKFASFRPHKDNLA